jgi:hypothetical protein
MLAKLKGHHSFGEQRVDTLRCGLIMLEKPGGLGTAVADGFAENGCDVHLALPQSVWDFSECDFVATYGPMQSMAWAIPRLTEIVQMPPLIVWFTEQIPRPDFPSPVIYAAARIRCSLERLFYSQSAPHWVCDRKQVSVMFRRAGRLRALGEMLVLKQRGLLSLLCVFTDTNLCFLQRYELPVTLIPMGYHPQFGERLALERDIDIVFLGSTRDRRRRGFICELENKLSAKRITFVIKDGSPERGYAFGRERTILLNRAKIMLNIMRQPWDDPVFRLLLAAPNGAMLLSEKLLPTSTGPFRPGEHFAMTNLADMVDAIEFYLAREDERQRIAECAYELATKKLTMGRMASEVLHALGF